MSTQVDLPSLSSASSDRGRKHLRIALLVSFLVLLGFELRAMPLHNTRSGGVAQGQVIYWALHLAPYVVLYAICWWRLARPTSRIPIGIALGLGARVLTGLFRSVVMPPLNPHGFVATTDLRVQQIVLFAASLYLAVAATIAWKSVASDRALPLVGLPVGFFFPQGVVLFANSIAPYLAFFFG